MRTRLRRAATAAATTSLVILAAGPAFADNLRADLAASGTTTITLSDGSASTTIKYFVQDTGPGCDVSTANPAVYQPVTGPGVTASPASVSFTACGSPSNTAAREEVVFTATTAGARTITMQHVSGPELNASPAAFTLTVESPAPTNTPPVVGYAGVEDGATYEIGAVPSASCTVTDAEDPAPATEPVVSAVTGPLAAHGLGSQSVTCSYTDAGGLTDTATATYTIVDTTAPVLHTPGDLVLAADTPADRPVSATASWAFTADDASALADTSCDVASPHAFPIGEHTVTCTATDVAGNSASDSFTVTVQDRTAPSLTVSDDITAEATGPDGAEVSYPAATADDNHDTDLTPTCAPPSGSVFALGATEVLCTVADSAGNAAEAGFTVEVVDTTGPAVTVPEPIVLEATGPDGATAEFAASATDLVDGDREVSCTPASGSTFALGTTAVSCTAADTRGNTTVETFDVTVQDTTAPVLELPADLSVGATSAAGATVVYGATATDVVDGSVPVTCSPASGSTFAPGTTAVTCSAVDRAGNEATGGFTVSVSFGWDGFFKPIDNGVYNTIKGGQTVPLKWAVPDGNGGWIRSLDVVTGLRPTMTSCTPGMATDAVEAPATGGTALRYDTTAEQYVYNWQTPKTAGKCYAVSVTLTDGSSHTALFKTK